MNGTTRYGGIDFESRLAAQWAAFFDLAGWWWQYKPATTGEAPAISDFSVEFRCEHSECSGFHQVYLSMGVEKATGEWGTGRLGEGPDSAVLTLLHGAGGGDDTLADWIREDVRELWERAGKLIV